MRQVGIRWYLKIPRRRIARRMLVWGVETHIWQYVAARLKYTGSGGRTCKYGYGDTTPYVVPQPAQVPRYLGGRSSICSICSICSMWQRWVGVAALPSQRGSATAWHSRPLASPSAVPRREGRREGDRGTLLVLHGQSLGSLPLPGHMLHSSKSQVRSTQPV